MLDTNAVGLQRPLDGGAVRFLVESHRDKQIRLLCPRVVVEEVVGRWDRELRLAAERHAQALAAVARFDVFAAGQSGLDVAHEVNQMRTRFAVSMRVANIEIIELPSVDHADVLARALRREQPFDLRGRDGYRDTLLWESVVAAAPRFERIVLVSADVAAFGELRKRSELAEVLRSEFVTRVGGMTRLDWVRDPQSAISLLGLARSEARAAAEDVFRHGRAALAERLTTLSDDRESPALMGVPIDLSRFGPPWSEAKADAAYISWANSVTDLRIGQARAQDDGTFFGTIIAKARVLISLDFTDLYTSAAEERSDLKRLLAGRLSWTDEERCGFELPATVDVSMTARFDPRTGQTTKGDDIEVVSGRIA